MNKNIIFFKNLITDTSENFNYNWIYWRMIYMFVQFVFGLVSGTFTLRLEYVEILIESHKIIIQKFCCCVFPSLSLFFSSSYPPSSSFSAKINPLTHKVYTNLDLDFFKKI